MKGFCPHCEKERDLTSIQSLREYTVKGEKIAVQRHVLKCQTCDKEFDPPDDSHDPLDEAYREGRIHRSDCILLSGFGAGLAWGTVLLRW